MKPLFKFFFFVFLLIVCIFSSVAQVKFRGGIFLHHSTGGCIWGPNGSATTVRDEMEAYNIAHSLTGGDSVSLQEHGWPETPWNNEWERWHRIFKNEDTIDADIRPLLQGNKIVIIKSCFPSSEVSEIGSPSDTLNPTNKSIYNYKWHWRNFIRVMKQYPENFFVVWTNAPLVDGATNDDQAHLSDQFCRWAKDTLANGLDSEFGSFPANVYVFDFFHKLAGPDGKLQNQYAQGDSHPNAAATELVAPQFVREVFDAAINYENLITHVESVNDNKPMECQLLQNYPNPFNPSTTINYVLSRSGQVKIEVIDMLGREIATLVNGQKQPGSYKEQWNADRMSSGIYFFRLQFDNKSFVRKMLLMK